MSLPIKSQEDLLRLRTRIADEVTSCSHFFRLHMRLRSAVPDYVREFNRAPAFWNLTLQAHFEAARTRLVRLYDQRQGGLNLKAWLRTIKTWVSDPHSNPDSLCRPIDACQIDCDERLVSERDDELVKRFVELRNAKVVHIDVKTLLHTDPTSPIPQLNYRDFEMLISRADEVLNKYSLCLDQSSYSMTLGGDDDYLRLLNDVRSAREQRQRDQ